MIDFPASPTDGQLFTTAGNGVVYKYSAAYTSWLAQNAAPAIGGTGDFCASGSGALPTTLTTAQPATSVSGNSGLWYTSANGQYRPPAGRYYLYGTMVATNPSAASSIQMVIRRNGTVIANSLDTISAAGYSAYVSPFTVIDANGADIFDWQINGFLASTTSNYFSIGAFPLTGMQGPTGTVGGVPLTNSLGSNVALNNASNYFDGPSVAQGSGGTWFATGTVTISSGAAATIMAKLWDGTTVIASAQGKNNNNGDRVAISLSGAATSPIGNIRISAKSSDTSSQMNFNDTGNSKDCTLSVWRTA